MLFAFRPSFLSSPLVSLIIVHSFLEAHAHRFLLLCFVFRRYSVHPPSDPSLQILKANDDQIRSSLSSFFWGMSSSFSLIFPPSPTMTWWANYRLSFLLHPIIERRFSVISSYHLLSCYHPPIFIINSPLIQISIPVLFLSHLSRASVVRFPVTQRKICLLFTSDCRISSSSSFRKLMLSSSAPIQSMFPSFTQYDFLPFHSSHLSLIFSARLLSSSLIFTFIRAVVSG